MMNGLNMLSFAGYEVFERMAFYGISANLVVYLTTKLHEGTVASSRNVNNWVGTVWLMPILGAYVADAHLGRYWTFLASSAIYLTVSTSSSLSLPPSFFSNSTVLYMLLNLQGG